MKKYIPYLYFIFGLILLVDAFTNFFEGKETYKIIFSWYTESKYLYLAIKTSIACAFIYFGLQKYNQLKE